MYLVVPPGGCFPETRRIELGPGALTIGRAEACEIRVDVAGVDDKHARISEVALIALGPDCAIGDVPLDAGSRRLLMAGDEIQIGSVVVVLEGDDPSLAIPPLDAQVTLRMAHADPHAQALAPKACAPRMQVPRIRVVEGSNFGDELLLSDDGRPYLVGRGPNCDLVVDDREVSRQHVRIMRKGYAVFVQDLSSTRGSWLGRAAVYTGATVEWARPRMMRVGATVLSLELPEAIRAAAPQAQASAPKIPPARSRSDLTPVALWVWGHTPQREGSVPPLSLPVAAPEVPKKKPAVVYSYDVTPAAVAAHAPLLAPPPSADFSPPPAPGSPPHVGMSLTSPATRKAWKKDGAGIGKASGLLLLAFAGLVILGGLFVVFSLLE